MKKTFLSLAGQDRNANVKYVLKYLSGRILLRSRFSAVARGAAAVGAAG